MHAQRVEDYIPIDFILDITYAKRKVKLQEQ